MSSKLSHALAIPVIIGIAVLARAQGLEDARLIDLDEYRAVTFDLDHTALFRLVYASWGHCFDGAPQSYLWLSVLVSVATILCLFLLGKSVAQDSTGGLIVASVGSLSVVSNWYARSAYPVSLATLFLTLAVLSWQYALVSARHRRLFLGAIGCSGALTLLTYLAWYPVILALLITAVTLPRIPGKVWSRMIVARGVAIGFPFVAVYFTGLWLLSAHIGLSLQQGVERLLQIQAWGETFVPLHPLQVVGGELSAIFLKEIVLLLGACLVALFTLPRGPMLPFARVMFIIAVIGLAVAIIPAATGFNTLYERNLVGQLTVIHIGVGLLLLAGYYRTQTTQRRGAEVKLTLLFAAALLALLTQRREMFSVTPINNWLAQHGAQASSVVTLLDIAAPGVAGPIALPHVQAQTPARPRAIDWARLQELARQRPALKYLLLTDFYQLRVSGERDRKLWRSNLALQTFSHPIAGESGIRIYDLRSALAE